ncbi:g5406 [Coccomyxa elongata]
MGKEVFEMLYGLMAHRIRRRDTIMRRAIPAKKRLMITLHWLATGMRFKDLADSWAIGKSTAQAYGYLIQQQQ